jgi:hypothetical protein
MSRPKVWDGIPMSKSLFVKIPQEAYERLEQRAYDEDKTLSVVMRAILCDAVGFKRPPRKKPKKK